MSVTGSGSRRRAAYVIGKIIIIIIIIVKGYTERKETKPQQTRRNGCWRGKVKGAGDKAG